MTESFHGVGVEFVVIGEGEFSKVKSDFNSTLVLLKQEGPSWSP